MGCRPVAVVVICIHKYELRTTPLWSHRCMWDDSIKIDREYDVKAYNTFFCLLTGSNDGFL